jgi:hypothetical protein
MAEQQTTTALVPVKDSFTLTVKDYDPAGKATELSAPLPSTGDFNQWTLVQQVVMLKKGAFKNAPVPEVVFAIAYARQLGLDVMMGDVFSTGEGRIGTSNKAKIKMALRTGNIEGVETEMRDTGEPISLTGCVQKTDLECTVTIHVKGWKKPIIRKARLSRWFKAKNPNWQGNPEHMLELNTVAHAMEYVNPTATESDEAPPLDAAVATTK